MLHKSIFRITFATLLKKTGSLAQLVEHDTLNVGVVGSSPTGTTDKRSITDGLSIALFLCVPKIEQGWFPRQAQIQYPQTTTPSVCVPFSVSMLRMEHHPGGSAIHLLLYPHGMHSWFDNRPSRQIRFRKELRIPTKNQAIVFRRIDQLIPHILRHAPHYTHPDHAKSGMPNFSALRSLFSIL